MSTHIVKYKGLTSDDVFKGFNKSVSTVTTLTGNNLHWYYVDRSNVTGSNTADDMKNLFHSFGIAREDEDDWFKVFNVTDWFNAKRMVICAIPQSGVSSHIDGSTVKLNVPWSTGATDYTTFYGSTYEGYPDPITNLQVSKDHADSTYGGAYCYLFGNTSGSNVGELPTNSYVANEDHPYTGTVDGNINPNSGQASFDPDSTATVAHLSATHWERGDDGGDKPYGIALLDRGIFVIFDYYNRTDFIGSNDISGITLWHSSAATLGTSAHTTGLKNDGFTNRKDIWFAGNNTTVNASITYRTVEQSYKMIYFCHAGQAEFNSTSNHTYNHQKGFYQPEEADSLWVTEIGLYDNNDDILAYGKLSEPVEKNKLETLTFKVELEL